MSATPFVSAFKTDWTLIFSAFAIVTGQKRFFNDNLHCATISAINEKLRKDSGLNCHTSKNAWVLESFFFAWIGRMDQHMTRILRKKLFFFVYNSCTEHGSKNDFLWNNIGVLRFPYSTTICTKWEIAGFFAALKKNCVANLCLGCFTIQKSEKILF